MVTENQLILLEKLKIIAYTNTIICEDATQKDQWNTVLNGLKSIELEEKAELNKVR